MRGLSTTQLRYAWGDGIHCYSGPLARVTLYGGAVISVRPAVVPVVKAFDAILRKHGYKATPPDCGAMNCRHITGGSKISLHGVAIAWDINWLLNMYQPNDGSIVFDIPMAVFRDVEKLMTGNGKPLIRCGMFYTGDNVDPMHFEVCCTPADLATGIKGQTPLIVPDKELWVPFRSGDTDKSIDDRGGLDAEVTEIQMILTRLAKLKNDPKLDPHGIDGEHRGYSETAVTWYKRRMIAEQRKRGYKVWPNDSPDVGILTINGLRFDNKYAKAA